MSVVNRLVVFGRGDSAKADEAGDWTLNQHYFDPARIDFHGKLNTTEVWELYNPTTVAHTLHVHLAQFQVLDGPTGSPPPPEETGWKDTILVRSQGRIRIILRWESFTGVYVFHCHMIGHEDNAMMLQAQIDE